jgi:hypothetical protein
MGKREVNLNNYMKSFKNFLMEDAKGPLFGIDPFGNRAKAEIMKMAANVGYTVAEGPKHTKIINPKTGQLVASISHGANRSEYNEKYVLKNLAKDLEASGSQLRPQMPAKVVADRIRSGMAQGKSFPRAGIAPLGLPVAQIAGEVLAEPVQRAGEESGLIDFLAKGIYEVIPTDILASGKSPAEEEREEMETEEKLKKLKVNPATMKALPI